MTRISIRKNSIGWCVYKNGRKLDQETSKLKASRAAQFYRGYFKVPSSKRMNYVRKARY